jgi:hypothetical protein
MTKDSVRESLEGTTIPPNLADDLIDVPIQ